MAVAREKPQTFEFDASAWRRSKQVRAMSFKERGMYLELLLDQLEQGFIPDDLLTNAQSIGASEKEFAKSWPTLRRCFVETKKSGLLVNDRMAEARAKSIRYSKSQAESGLRGATERWRRHRLAIGSLGKPIGGAIATPMGSDSPRARVRDHVSLSQDLKKEKERDLVRGDPDPTPRVSAPSGDPFVDPTVTTRASQLIERYQTLYQKHRHGARYAVKPMRDYAAAVTLCQTWTDDTRLDKLAVIFLTTDHKFAEEGSRTLPQFLALASWCDSKLAEHEASKGVA